MVLESKAKNNSNIRKRIIITLAACIVIVAGLSFWGWRVGWFREDEVATKQQHTKTPMTMTREQEIHQTKSVRRVDGRVLSVQGNRIEVAPLEGSDSGSDHLPLILTDDTVYSRGSNFEESDKTGLSVDSLVVVNYDNSTNIIISIWMDYDES